MRKILSVPLLALVLLPGLLFAQEQQFAFALPELEGRISLGVFDSADKLVRTLFVGAAEGDFKVGLNGLIATWDGKTDDGKAAASGKYRIRGYVVGYEVQAEGVAYHFNDWIEDDNSPEISGIGAVVPGEKDRLLLFGFKPSHDKPGLTDVMLWRFDETARLQITGQLPPQSKFLAVDPGSDLLAISAGKLILYDFARVKESSSKTGDTTYSAGAFWNSHLYLQPDSSGAKEISELGLTLNPTKQIPAPIRFQGLDANPAAFMGWDATGVWFSREGNFVPAPLKELPVNLTLSAGLGESFWIAGKHGTDVIVRQHAFDGELLRQMKISEDFAETVQISASKTSLSFYLLFHSRGWSRQTLRGYRPAATPPSEGATQVDWEVFLDKTIENSRRFGFVEGKLVPDAGRTPQSQKQKITLLASTLNAKGSTLTLQAAGGPSGLWLQTTDGLPLLCLTTRKFFDRTVVSKGDAPESLRVFAGDGTVVSEYLVTGLANLAEMEAGEIEIP